MTKREIIAIFELLKEIGGLKNIFRSGWVQAGISPSDVESVADHSFRVTFISMIISDYIIKEKRQKINIEKVVRMALLHDLAETRIGDLHLTATIYIGKKNKDIAETKAFEDLINAIDSEIGSRYMEIFKEYIKEETLEAKIVRCADIIDMLLQAIHYNKIGYPKGILDNFWHQKEYMEHCNLPIVRDLMKILLDVWAENSSHARD